MRCPASLWAGVVLMLAAAACTPRLEPAGPAVSPPALTDNTIDMADGAQLPMRRWLPGGPPRAIVLGLHGFNDYSKSFETPGQYWATHSDIATYAFDQRGFGGAPNRGLWAGHRTLARDIVTATALLRRAHPGVPLFVAGESMGGALAMIAAADFDLQADGLILLAPALRGRPYLGAVPRFSLWLLSRLIPWYPLTGQGVRVQASDNIEMLRALGRDPLYIRETRVDSIYGLVNAMDAAIETPDRLEIPALVVYGARDELIPKKPTFDMIHRLSGRIGHRSAVYDGGWHMLLRDLKAEVVMRDISAWISDPAAPLPSGADIAARTALAKNP